MVSRILIVASDCELVAALQHALADNADGCQCFTAPSSRSALAEVGIDQPDLMIVDLGLPDDEGWETLSRVRELSDLPVIAIASGGDDRTGAECLQRGADTWLPRPLPARELCARVRALLRRDRLRVGGESVLPAV